MLQAAPRADALLRVVPERQFTSDGDVVHMHICVALLLLLLLSLLLRLFPLYCRCRAPSYCDCSATQAIRRTMMMTMASEHAHDQVSKQTLKVVLLQLSLCLTGSVIQLVLIEVVVIIHSSLDDDWVNER